MLSVSIVKQRVLNGIQPSECVRLRHLSRRFLLATRLATYSRHISAMVSECKPSSADTPAHKLINSNAVIQCWSRRNASIEISLQKFHTVCTAQDKRVRCFALVLSLMRYL